PSWCSCHAGASSSSTSRRSCPSFRSVSSAAPSRFFHRSRSSSLSLVVPTRWVGTNKDTLVPSPSPTSSSNSARVIRSMKSSLRSGAGPLGHVLRAYADHLCRRRRTGGSICNLADPARGGQTPGMDPKAPPPRRRAWTYLSLGVGAALVAALLVALDVDRTLVWVLVGLALGALLVGAAQFSSARDRASS